MVVAEFFYGQMKSELLQQLADITRRCLWCKASAQNFKETLEDLFPIIQEIKYSGVELPEHRQVQLDHVSRLLQEGVELSRKMLSASRWEAYKSHQLARKMERLDKEIKRFFQTNLMAYILADVHHLRSEMAVRFDSLERSGQRMEQSLWDMRIGSGGWVEDAVRARQEAEGACGGEHGVVVSVEMGKRSVREMLIDKDDVNVVGISGMGGSGKTTLAREVIKDPKVQAHFNNRILFLTVSQSPNLDCLRVKILSFLMGYDGFPQYDQVQKWNMQDDFTSGPKALVVLDDVWTPPVLEKLVFKVPGCKTLVVSRFHFPTVCTLTHEVELLREEEAMMLFCHAAFDQKAVPPDTNQNLVKQVVSECKGLPLALKVIGASLRDQPERYWSSAKARLSKGEPICDSHESKLLERMAISIEYLQPDVRECFLDLGSFPEDMKIPLDLLINMWVETRGIDEEEAFAIVVELSNKNLLTLVKDARAGEMYSSYFEISVTQHDILRDLSLRLNNQSDINARKRLLMPRRESELPREWERNSDRPFNAQIVSVHTGEMLEMSWPRMEFPKAEVLILNFSAGDYFLPPFIDDMPNLRALIVINHSTSNAVLRNFSVFNNLTNLRSLWLDKICVPPLTDTTIPLDVVRKVCLVLCKINNSLSLVHLPQIFPCLSDLTINHCDDLSELPSSICGLHFLRNLSITNCHSLQELPADLDRLSFLEILRVYACPNLRTLPPGVCELGSLKYLDISQCVNLTQLPDAIAKLTSLEKIDMRECPQIRYLPRCFTLMKSLTDVICDEEVSRAWKEVARTMPGLNVRIPENCFTLDWLDE